MKKISLTLVFVIVITTLISTGCTQTPTVPPETSELNLQIQNLTLENEKLKEETKLLKEALEAPPLYNANSLLDTALHVVSLLKAEDMEALSAIVHPTAGVRFSPYGYTDVQKDQSFKAEAVEGLLNEAQTFNWGAYDGTGDPILLNGREYFQRFVYDQDYLHPHLIGVNALAGKGNTLVNIPAAYPNASFVEFHFTGFDPQFEGIDWRSLILVFESVENKWYLSGIVHNEWTT